MAQTQNKQSGFKHILFCSDLSENAEFAFSFAIDMAMRNTDGEFYLLHVIPESEAQFWKTYVYEVEGVDDKAKNDLDRQIREHYLMKLPDGLSMQVEYRTGKDSQQILEFAKEKQIDLIIMGRQGHHTMQKPFFGNVIEKVVRKADCAVMIIPDTLTDNIEEA